MNIFRTLFYYYTVWFVTYVFANFIDVENVPRSVTKVYFRLFPSPGLEKMLQQLSGSFFDLWLTADLHIFSAEPTFLPHPPSK